MMYTTESIKPTPVVIGIYDTKKLADEDKQKQIEKNLASGEYETLRERWIRCEIMHPKYHFSIVKVDMNTIFNLKIETGLIFEYDKGYYTTSC